MLQSVIKFKYQQVTVNEEKELGRGNYGRVCKAMCDELPCAAKLLNPKVFDLVDSANLECFNRGCETLYAINHPCIVQYIDAYIHPETGQAVLLMELMDESLTSFLDRSLNPLPIYIQIDLCYDVIQALSYLHSHGIIHRNLTGSNILVHAGSRAKVTDFGMMKMIRSQQTLNPHLKHMALPDSSAYMPPEASRYPPSYSDQIDTFSFGVVSLQVMTRQFPQPSSSRVSEIERRRSDISLVEPDHVMLPITLSCLKDTDILRPAVIQLCRKMKQLRGAPLYEKSRREREKALQEIDSIRTELIEVQRENEELVSQMENVHLENEQLSKLIAKCSKNITPNTIQSGKDDCRGPSMMHASMTIPWPLIRNVCSNHTH